MITHPDSDIERIETLCSRINAASGFSNSIDIEDLAKPLPQRSVIWYYSLPRDTNCLYAIYMPISPIEIDPSGNQLDLRPYFEGHTAPTGLDYLLRLHQDFFHGLVSPSVDILAVKADNLDELERKTERLEAQSNDFVKVAKALLLRAMPAKLPGHDTLWFGFTKPSNPGNG